MFGGDFFLFAVKYSMQCLIKIFILNHCLDQGCKIETLEQSYRRILCSTPLHFIHRSYRDTALHFLGAMSHDKPDSCSQMHTHCGSLKYTITLLITVCVYCGKFQKMLIRRAGKKASP